MTIGEPVHRERLRLAALGFGLTAEATRPGPGFTTHIVRAVHGDGRTIEARAWTRLGAWQDAVSRARQAPPAAATP